MAIFFGLLAWTFFSVVVGNGAKNRGRSFAKYLILSLIVSPILGAFVLFVLGENPFGDQKANIEIELINRGRAKRCPYCDELIRSAAKICKYCGHELGEK